MEDINEAVEEVEETRAMTQLCYGHLNLPKFLGVFLNKTPVNSLRPQIWIVMELCAAGTVSDLIRKRLSSIKCISPHLRDLFSSNYAPLIDAKLEDEPTDNWLVAHCPCQKHRRRRHRRRYRMHTSAHASSIEGPNIFPPSVFGRASTDVDPSMESVESRVTGRLSECLIGYILGSTASALSHLHNAGVIHRDVKGSNILLTDQGIVKLVDFGVSCRLKDALSSRNTIIGTPYWMAPEVITSQAGDPSCGYNTTADVWSLGITAIELWDGEPPLAGVSPMQALNRIPEDPSPISAYPIKEKNHSNALRQLVPKWNRKHRSQMEDFFCCSDGLSKDFYRFLSKCLIKDPRKRPHASEIVKDQFLAKFAKQSDQLRIRLLQTLESTFSAGEVAISNVISTKSVDRPSETKSVATPLTPTLKAPDPPNKQIVGVAALAGTKETTSLVCMARNMNAEQNKSSKNYKQKSPQNSVMRSNSFCHAQTNSESEQPTRKIVPPRRRSSLGLSDNPLDWNGIEKSETKFIPKKRSVKDELPPPPKSPMPEDLKSGEIHLSSILPPPPIVNDATGWSTFDATVATTAVQEYDNYQSESGTTNSLVDQNTEAHDSLHKTNQHTCASIDSAISLEQNLSDSTHMHDLAKCSHLTLTNILDRLEYRFDHGLYYTKISDILISVNPQGNDCHTLYSPRQSDQYIQKVWAEHGLSRDMRQRTYLSHKVEKSGLSATNDLPPHIFGLATSIYVESLLMGSNQVVIISGESGSGKTTSADLIVKQIVHIVSHQKLCSHGGVAKNLEQCLLRLQAPMEAVGNAQTRLNSNSSRCAKVTELLVSSDCCQNPIDVINSGNLSGGSFHADPIHFLARISHYLLERSRVANVNAGESNFHIFGQLLIGAENVVGENFGLRKEKAYQLLSSTHANAFQEAQHNREIFRSFIYTCPLPLEHVSVDKFREVHESLLFIGFTDEEIAAFYRIIAAILHLGNLIFVPQNYRPPNDHENSKKGLKTEESNGFYLNTSVLSIDDHLKNEFDSFSSDSEGSSLSVAESTLDQYSLKEPDADGLNCEGLWDSFEKESKEQQKKKKKKKFRLPGFVYGLKGRSENPFLVDWGDDQHKKAVKLTQFQKFDSDNKPDLKQMIKSINQKDAKKRPSNSCFSAWRKDFRKNHSEKSIKHTKTEQSPCEEKVDQKDAHVVSTDNTIGILQPLTLAIIARLLGLCPLELSSRLTGSELTMPVRSSNTNSESIFNSRKNTSHTGTDANTTVSSSISFRFSGSTSNFSKLPPRPQLPVNNGSRLPAPLPPQGAANPSAPLVSGVSTDDSLVTTTAVGPLDESSIYVDGGNTFSASSRLDMPKTHPKPRRKRMGPAGCSGCFQCERQVKVEPLQATCQQRILSSCTDEERIKRNWSVEEAQASRAAFVRSLYGRLVAWLIGKMNQRLMLGSLINMNQSKDKKAVTLSILDMFGFENLPRNSFEQLCINLANEELQYYFNLRVFQWELVCAFFLLSLIHFLRLERII
ncbi:Myosin-IIIa [Cichlidogyrus casuarinus]|uniref:Myosin-IIIa n=1 Tax=Cichlidogyrus casuarinus TaxID=1844966 RepID=A0ABD2QMS5_9PLAT